MLFNPNLDKTNILEQYRGYAYQNIINVNRVYLVSNIRWECYRKHFNQYIYIQGCGNES